MRTKIPIGAKNLFLIRNNFSLSMDDVKKFIIANNNVADIENLIENGSLEDKINYLLLSELERGMKVLGNFAFRDIPEDINEIEGLTLT